MRTSRSRFAACAWMAVLLVLTAGVQAAELQQKTVDAFNRYVAESDRQMAATANDPARFLWVNRLPDARRRTTLDILRRGEIAIERQEIRIAGKKVDAPGGIIHHWLGVAFVPHGTIDTAAKLLLDYDRHADLFKPAVPRARTIARSGDTYRAAIRFYMKKVISVVVNTEFETKYIRVSPTQATIYGVSTRVAEVEDPDTPEEREKPVGEGGGYMWRMNTYWRLEEADGGVYLQCESISLSRSIPFGLGWMIGPFVTGIPKESLDFVLTKTRQTLVAQPQTAGF